MSFCRHFFCLWRATGATSTVNAEDTCLNNDAIEVVIDDDEKEKKHDVNFTSAMTVRGASRACVRAVGESCQMALNPARARNPRAAAVQSFVIDIDVYPCARARTQRIP